MSSVLEMLTNQLGGSTLKEISSQLGTDEKTTRSTVGAALPTLVSALSRNASRPEGAQALHDALARDHDGRVLDDPSALIRNPRDGAGDGILGHVLGARRSRVEAGISATTGMPEASTSNLMSMLAPLVMGALGREQRKGKMDAGALAGLLGRERSGAERAAPEGMGILNKLLDADDDGDVDVADIVKHGSGLLGKMIKGR